MAGEPLAFACYVAVLRRTDGSEYRTGLPSSLEADGTKLDHAGLTFRVPKGEQVRPTWVEINTG